MSLKCRYAKTKSRYKLEKCHYLISSFIFSAKVGFDSELKNSNFLREIGLFNIGKYFQPMPRIENSFAIPGFSIWKVAAQLFRWIFRINSVNEAIFKYPGNFDLKNDSKQFWGSFKHFPVFSLCSELKSRAYNIAFAKYRAGQWNFSSSNMATVVRG